MSILRRGDKCWVRRPFFRHYGICVGHNSSGPIFVHNVPAGGVTLVTLAAFAKGQPIFIAQRAKPGDEDAVVRRAMALRGRHYDLFAFNCEHAASFAATGRAESVQLQRGLFAIALGLFLSSSEKTWVDDNGYRRDRAGRFAR